MFDDQQTNQPAGGIPPNLPIGEPEDIFAGTEVAGERMRSVGDAVMDQTSALEAGVLRPKIENSPRQQVQTVMAQNQVDNTSLSSASASLPENYDLKEPGIGKFIFRLFVVVIVVAVLGGVGWFAYTKLVKQNTGNEGGPAVDQIFVPEGMPVDATSTELGAGVGEDAGQKIEGMAGDIQDDAILFGAPVDKDGDGIDDTRELQIGTDPNNWDTDGDGLSDGDEILIWQTDPLDSDTDGDGFPDGSEVKNGYNPRGPGKLFAPPTTTTSTVVSGVAALDASTTTLVVSSGVNETGSLAEPASMVTSTVVK